MRGIRGSLASVGAILALHPLAPAPAGAAEPWAQDPVYVYYGRGDCRGSELELQVWDRDREAWRPHPGHPRVPLDSCQLEDAGRLFNEIRARCVEPPDSDPPPAWVVGLDVFDPAVMETCAPHQLAGPQGDLELQVVTPEPGERVASPRMEVTIQGAVRMNGIEGSDYDLELVIDRSSPTHAGDADLLHAQLDAARALVETLAPRLGPVRIGIVAYPNLPPRPGSLAGAGARRVVPLTDDPARLRRGLAELAARGTSGFSTFGSAFDFATSELEGLYPGSGARARARKLLAIAANGSDERPFGHAAASDARFVSKLGERLQHARDHHLSVHLFALGGIAEALDPSLRELFERADARFDRVLRPALATAFFSRVSLPRVTEVVVANRTAGGQPLEARVEPNGRFDTTVAAATGVNRIWARATLSDGATTEREWAFEFDDRLVRERLLAAEREHMRRIRQKALDLRALWGNLPDTRDVAAPPPK